MSFSTLLFTLPFWFYLFTFTLLFYFTFYFSPLLYFFTLCLILFFNLFFTLLFYFSFLFIFWFYFFFTFSKSEFRVKSEYAENSVVLSDVSGTRAESTPVKFGPERRVSIGDSGIVSLGKLILIALWWFLHDKHFFFATVKTAY